MTSNNKWTSFSDLWTRRIAKQGMTAIPTLLIQNQATLGITNSELVTLIAIISFRWAPETPYPSIRTLCEFSGQAESTISNHTRSLEKKGYINRIAREGTSNEYDITPLIRRLDAGDLTLHTPLKKLIPPPQISNSPPRQKTKDKVDPSLDRRSKDGGLTNLKEELDKYHYRKWRYNEDVDPD